MKSYFRVASFILVLRVSYIRFVVPCLTRERERERALDYLYANLRSLKVSLYYIIWIHRCLPAATTLVSLDVRNNTLYNEFAEFMARFLLPRYTCSHRIVSYIRDPSPFVLATFGNWCFSVKSSNIYAMAIFSKDIKSLRDDRNFSRERRSLSG